jgi:hypothetical protein
MEELLNNQFHHHYHHRVLIQLMLLFVVMNVLLMVAEGFHHHYHYNLVLQVMLMPEFAGMVVEGLRFHCRYQQVVFRQFEHSFLVWAFVHSLTVF